MTGGTSTGGKADFLLLVFFGDASFFRVLRAVLATTLAAGASITRVFLATSASSTRTDSGCISMSLA